MRDGNAVIVFTEHGCLVDDTSTLIGRDVRIVENVERPVFELHIHSQVKALNHYEALGHAPAP